MEADDLFSFVLAVFDEVLATYLRKAVFLFWAVVIIFCWFLFDRLIIVSCDIGCCSC